MNGNEVQQKFEGRMNEVISQLLPFFLAQVGVELNQTVCKRKLQQVLCLTVVWKFKCILG